MIKFKRFYKFLCILNRFKGLVGFFYGDIRLLENRVIIRKFYFIYIVCVKILISFLLIEVIIEIIIIV